MHEDAFFFFPCTSGSTGCCGRPLRRVGEKAHAQTLELANKERTKTEPPEKGQRMSPRQQKCYQPLSTASAWQEPPGQAQPCQISCCSHLLLWATASALTRTSPAPRLGRTCRTSPQVTLCYCSSRCMVRSSQQGGILPPPTLC